MSDPIRPVACPSPLGPSSLGPSRRALLRVAGLAALAIGPGAAALAQEGEPSIDPRLSTETVTFQIRKRTYKGLLVRLRSGPKRPGLLLLPDQRGVTAFYRQTARRFALDGFVVLVPDLLSPYTITDDNSDEGPNILGRIAPAEHMLVFDAAAELLAKHPECTGALGVLGFVWGGAFALQFAMAGGRVKSVVAFYPSLPSADKMAEIKVPVQLHWPEDDPRSAGSIETLEKRMSAAGRSFEEWTYPDTASGFASEPGSRRFNRAAADHAYDRAVFFLHRTLG